MKQRAKKRRHCYRRRIVQQQPAPWQGGWLVRTQTDATTGNISASFYYAPKRP